MEKIEKVVEVIKEIRYVAIDGREFKDKYDCQVYEKYCNKSFIDLIKDYVVLTPNAIEQVKNKKIPCFEYAFMLKSIPTDLQRYFVLQELNEHIPNGIPDNLYYCNYSAAFNGGYGSNGWERVGTKQELEYNLKRIQERLQAIDELKQI